MSVKSRGCMYAVWSQCAKWDTAREEVEVISEDLACVCVCVCVCACARSSACVLSNRRTHEVLNDFQQKYTAEKTIRFQTDIDRVCFDVIHSWCAVMCLNDIWLFSLKPSKLNKNRQRRWLCGGRWRMRMRGCVILCPTLVLTTRYARRTPPPSHTTKMRNA